MDLASLLASDHVARHVEPSPVSSTSTAHLAPPNLPPLAESTPAPSEAPSLERVASTSGADAVLATDEQPRLSAQAKGKGKAKAAAAPRKRAPAKKPKAKSSRSKGSSAQATPDGSDDDDYAPVISNFGRSRRENDDYVEETEVEDDRLYCLCRQRYNSDRLMIACDRCDDWYHTDCVKIAEDDVELVNDFICPLCEEHTSARTTWKPRCIRPECNRAAVRLSKYCSDWCGIEVAATRLEDTGLDPMRFWPAVATATKLRAIVVRPGVEPARNAQLAPDRDQPPPSAPITPITPTVTPGIRAAAHEDGRRFERSRIESGLVQLGQRRKTIETAHELVSSRIRFLGHVVQRADALQAAHIARHAPDLLRPPDAASDSVDAPYVPAAPLGNKKSAAKQRASAKAAVQQKNRSRAQAEAAKARVGAGAPCAFDVRLAWDDRDWQAFVASDAGGRTLEQGLPELTAADRPDAAGEDAEAEEALIEDPDGFVCLETRKRCDRHSGWDRLIEAGFAAERTAHTAQLEKLAASERKMRRRLEDLAETTAAEARAQAKRNAGAVPSTGSAGPMR